MSISSQAINNALYNVNVAALAEILPLVEAHGIPPACLEEIVSNGTGQSFGFDKFSPLVASRSFEAPMHGYPMGKAFKDMETVAWAAKAVKLQDGSLYQLPVITAAEDTYREALALGLSEEVKGAMAKVFERIPVEGTT